MPSYACNVCGVIGPKSICPAHAEEMRRARDAGRQRPAGYDTRWRKTAKAYLAKHSFCAMCVAKATMVDHIDGQGRLGPRGYDETNFMALCRSCHSRKTAMVDGGFGNPRGATPSTGTNSACAGCPCKKRRENRA